METVIIIGIGGMLLFAIGIIIFVLFHQRRVIQYQLNLQKLKEEQQKLLLQATIESAEAERQRIASDLHDEIGGSLSTVRLYLNRSARATSMEQLNETNAAAKQLLDDIILKARQLSHQLSPELLNEFGLSGAFKTLANKISSSGQIKVDFSCEGYKNTRLKPDQELALYRIVQELLNNIIKHAGASAIKLTLSNGQRQLYLRLEDNGKCFSQESFEAKKNSPDGLGLKNIQSRINILNASLKFVCEDNGHSGTKTTINLSF